MAEMGLLRRSVADDDVDAESCLANIHRIDELLTDRPMGVRAPARVVDIREPTSSGADVESEAERFRPVEESARR